MNMRSVTCTWCKAPVAPDLLDDAFHFCPTCDARLRIHIFPALAREHDAPVETALSEGHSSCFYHAHKRAVITCENCGRFLCSLCDVEIGGVHCCPACLESGKRKQELVALEVQHTRYDRIALALTTMPFITLFFWWLSLLAAPAALFLVIRFWNRKSKILPGTHMINTIAGLLAIAEICGWIALFYFLFQVQTSHGQHR